MSQPDYQSTFTKVYLGLLNQGVASVRSDGLVKPICMYRGENGNKCAVGHLIPDELYTRVLETVGVTDRSSLAMKMLLDKLFPERDDDFLEFLGELQLAHDGVLHHNGLTDWRGRMGEIADNYGLVVPA